MPEGTTIFDLHGRLLRDTFGPTLDDSDAFLVFVLFHHYQIELSGPVLTDRPNLQAGDRVHAETQRGCSGAIASLWSGSDDERASYVYWYRRWNGEWGSYGHAERLSAEEKARLRALMKELERHPFVRRIMPEDDDLLAADANDRGLESAQPDLQSMFKKPGRPDAGPSIG
jgi:hypothetical protein